jgi:hypothetical protein
MDARRSPYWGKYEDYVLPSGRDWKTHWKASRQHYWNDESSGADPKSMGWQKGIHYTTGQERSRYETSGGRGLDTGYNLIEVLDYDAYNKDSRYQQGWKGLGRSGSIGSLQDILDIEDYFSGAGERNAEKQRKADEQLKATNDQINLLKQQLEDARKPRRIDVGQGVTVGEGDVADYFLGLDQQRAKELDALTKSLSTQYSTSLDKAKDTWTSRYDQQHKDWVSRTAARDKVHDTRIADLTADWDTQRSVYDTSLSNLSGQFAQQRRDWDTQRSIYDTSLSNLNQSISDYHDREQKRLEEAAIESQRARTAAAYAHDGPLNPKVGGVKTERGLTNPGRNRYGSSFKRSYMTNLTNKQLNI